jgi:hypothetical protein
MAPLWLFLAPVLWLAFIYVAHFSNEPLEAVIGWALIFAPFYLVVCIAELYARIHDWWKYRSFEKQKSRAAARGTRLLCGAL